MAERILNTAFGLVGNADFGITQGQTLLSGRQRLVSMVSAPAGILLKRVDTLQECIDAGGAFFYSVSDPTQWAFAVGRTFWDMLAKNTLMKFPTLMPVPGGPNVAKAKLRAKPKYNGSFDIYHSNGAQISTKLLFGFDWEFQPTLLNRFNSGDTLGVLAIVTSATEGCGYNKVLGPSSLGATNGSFSSDPPCTSGMSFMATHVPMNATFREFLEKTKDVTIAAAPAKVREYYVRSFRQAADSYVYKNVKPTIAVSTHWEGTEEIAPRVYSAKERTPAAHFSGWATHSTWDMDGVPMDGPVQYRAPYNSSTSLVGSKEIIVPPRGRFMLVPGTFSKINPADLPYMNNGSPRWTEYVEVAAPAGVVQGMRMGLLRDGHTVRRALVDGARYANDVSPYATLAEYVSKMIDPKAYDSDMEVDMDAITDQDALARAAEYKIPVGAKLGTVFSRSTLPQYLEHFNDTWDAAAQALARSEN